MVSSPACIHFANYRIFSSGNIQAAEGTHRPSPSPFCRKGSVASGQYVMMFRHEFPGAMKYTLFFGDVLCSFRAQDAACQFR